MILVQIQGGFYPTISVLNEGRNRESELERDLTWTNLRYLGLEFRKASQLSQADKAEGNYHFAHEFEGFKLTSAATIPDRDYGDRMPELPVMVAAYLRGRETGLLSEAMTFTKFIHFYDLLAGVEVGSSVTRRPGLFLDDDGTAHFLYLQGSRLKSVAITESALIDRYKVCPISQLVDRARTALETERAEKEALFEKIMEGGSFRNHELFKQVLSAGLQRLTHGSF